MTVFKFFKSICQGARCLSHCFSHRVFVVCASVCHFVCLRVPCPIQHVLLGATSPPWSHLTSLEPPSRRLLCSLPVALGHSATCCGTSIDPVPPPRLGNPLPAPGVSDAATHDCSCLGVAAGVAPQQGHAGDLLLLRLHLHLLVLAHFHARELQRVSQVQQYRHVPPTPILCSPARATSL